MKTTLGILAHVDAGKTTLSEALLYRSGTIHRLGRVDHRDTYLDSGEEERARGITIKAKQAAFQVADRQITLIDTPGHTDFASEAEAVLPVLDCAILLISLADGVTAHTRTLWTLLARHRVPVFVFVNKIDLPGRDKNEIITQLRETFGSGFFDCSGGFDEENCAMLSEELMEEYLVCGSISLDSRQKAVKNRLLYPVFFGSALKMIGVDDLLCALSTLSPAAPDSPPTAPLGAKVFRIEYDEKGGRITHLKLTSGSLKARSLITLRTKKGDPITEKIDRITVLDGKNPRVVEEIGAGDIAMLTGLTQTRVGQGIGIDREAPDATLLPVMSYRLRLPLGASAYEWMPKLRKLDEENPLLRLSYHERTGEIRICLTGEVQTEVLVADIERRFGISVQIDSGSLLYQETITKTVEGVGHFEPLRHYAEVHLLLEPLARGEGLKIASSCPPDRLAYTWQRCIMECLKNEVLTGVLTNSPLTDLRITLISGRAHPKHTETPDFVQATSRALRQGLMRAESLLLEPYYDFALTLPPDCLGRAMTDLDNLGGILAPPIEENGNFTLEGSAPVAKLREYLPEIPSYTKGMGHISLRPGEYRPVKEQEQIVSSFGYNPETDPDKPIDSIFCKNGAGYAVHWSQAEGMMHVPTRRHERSAERKAELRARKAARSGRDFDAEERELMAIFERTYGPIRRRSVPEKSKIVAENQANEPNIAPKTEYILVDAYNVIFSWEELREAAGDSLDLARSMLLHILANYRGYRGCRMIVVFDAYRTGNEGKIEQIDDIFVVYTAQSETADAFIERVSYLLGAQKREGKTVRVVTSDGPEQLIVLGNGGIRVSSEAFREEVTRVSEEISDLLERLGRDRSGQNGEGKV